MKIVAVLPELLELNKKLSASPLRSSAVLYHYKLRERERQREMDEMPSFLSL
jgi:hypothetical protein